MTDLGSPLSSLPSRRFELDELDDLEASDRFLAVLHDDEMIDLEEPHVFVRNCVFVTGNAVTAAVFVEAEQGWYRVYERPRDEAVLTDAYDAVREFRDDESLFGRQPLSVAEVIFAANRPSGSETSGYEEGDAFDCPVCGETHAVQFDDMEAAYVDENDLSTLYVDCPEASNGELYVEYQASTPD